jgi:molecular chaperone GrpE
VPEDVKRTTGDADDGKRPESDDATADQSQASVTPDVHDGSPDGDGDRGRVFDRVQDDAAERDAGDRVEDAGADAAEGDEAVATVLEIQGDLLEEKPEPEGEPPPDLSNELAEARAESARYLDDLRRLKAEFENFRKRMMRDQSAVIASASSALVNRLLPVLDNFDLAISAAEQSQDFEKMLKGVEMVYGELREVLRGEGLTEIEAEGKPFDPQRHEAVVAVEQDGVEPGTVVGVVRAGYELQGRVLRPAMVKVAQ